jgi:hypothetical protein
LWLDAIVNSGPFEKRAYWLRRELENSYKQFHHTHYRYPNAENYSHMMFSIVRPMDSLTSEILTHLAVAYSMKSNSKDYVGSVKTILQILGYKDGLLDEKLQLLSCKETLRKVLTTTDLWDPDMDNEKK